MDWTVEYNDTARTQLRRLDREIARRIEVYMQNQVAVLENPRLRGRGLSRPLAGLWRYRIGDYRVICDIQDEVLRVLVIALGHRSQVYS